jgi:integrase/recombinase XerD
MMTIADLITKFESYLLTEKRVSENTFVAYKRDLRQFTDFLKREGLERALEEVQAVHLSSFISFLHDAHLSIRSIARKIAALKGFCAYVEQFGITNHAKEITMPKLPHRLPEFISESEIEQMFDAASQDKSPTGKRNMVMLYTMYVTGMRVSELVNLKVENVHGDVGYIRVDGKGGRQRMIPIPEVMITMLVTYMNHDRGILLKKHGMTEYLFPILYGGKLRPISRQAFWFIVKQLWKKAGIKRPVSPHTLRHSFATHMLKKGADMRSLQILLGHEHLSTVQTYTHVDTSYLRTIYDKKHPRSK